VRRYSARLLDVPINTNNDARWTEPKAWRSAKSAPAVAARSLEHAFVQTHTFSPTPHAVERFSLDRITFASFARSGAEVLAGLIDPQDGDNDFIGAGQIEECRRTVGDRRIDALLINIGGNDAGFAGALEDLVAKDSIWTGSLRGTLKDLALSAFNGLPGDDKLGRDQVEARLMQRLGIGLPDGQIGPLEQHYNVVKGLVDQLTEHPGIGDVHITGYPVGLFDRVAADGSIGFRACEIFDGPDIDMTPADGKLIKRVGHALNDLIAKKAAEFGWHFVEVEKAFEGHGYCAGDRSFWRTAKQSCEQQGDFEGTMHPNAKGVEAWAEQFATGLRTHTVRPRPLPT
jgi:hypothetical protein